MELVRYRYAIVDEGLRLCDVQAKDWPSMDPRWLAKAIKEDSVVIQLKVHFSSRHDFPDVQTREIRVRELMVRVLVLSTRVLSLLIHVVCFQRMKEPVTKLILKAVHTYEIGCKKRLLETGVMTKRRGKKEGDASVDEDNTSDTKVAFSPSQDETTVKPASSVVLKTDEQAFRPGDGTASSPVDIALNDDGATVAPASSSFLKMTEIFVLPGMQAARQGNEPQYG